MLRRHPVAIAIHASDVQTVWQHWWPGLSAALCLYPESHHGTSVVQRIPPRRSNGWHAYVSSLAGLVEGFCDTKVSDHGVLLPVQMNSMLRNESLVL